MPHRPNYLFIAFLTITGVAAIGGCATSGDDSIGHSLIKAESAPRVLNQALLAQAATGAAEDRMLFEGHFNGASLNSLGEQKLALMMEDPAWQATPEVFVTAGANGRLSTVQAFFEQFGLTEYDVRVQLGSNPAAAQPAAVFLAREAAFGATQVEQVDERR